MARQVKHSRSAQVIRGTGSGIRQLLPSAEDSGIHLRDLHLRLARCRQVALTCFAVSIRGDAVLGSTPPIGLVRRMPRDHAIQSPCEDERWRWFQAVAMVVMLGFRTAGKWTQPRFDQRDRQGIAWLSKRFWKALTLI